jgi:hypothetical protein
MANYWVEGTESAEAEKSFFERMEATYSENNGKSYDETEICYQFGDDKIIIQNGDGELFLSTFPLFTLNRETFVIREKSLAEKVTSLGFKLEDLN